MIRVLTGPRCFRANHARTGLWHQAPLSVDQSEQLMISEAVHRGETVYNVALRVDPASLMARPAFH